MSKRANAAGPTAAESSELTSQAAKRTEHTPGPWLSTATGPVMNGYSQPLGIASAQNHPTLIAGVFGDVRGGMEVAKANARLIAAAPELLEALKLARHMLSIACGTEAPFIKTGLSKIDPVIAKAEGR